MRRSLLAALFGLGFAAAWLVTRAPLPGLSPDSASYLGAADALVHGEGLRIPMAKWWAETDSEPLRHFPPGYPLLLALPISLGAAPLITARAIQALAAGCVLALAAWSSASVAGVSAGLLVALMLLLTSAVVQDFLPVLSEPLFLCLVLGVVALNAQPRARPLVSIGLCMAGVLVRYAGISLLLACMAREALRPAPLALRARRAVILALPVLTTLWLWRRLSGEFRRYQLLFEGMPAEGARALRTLSAWIAPGLDEQSALPLWIAGLVLALAALGLVRAWRSAPAWYGSALRQLAISAGLFAVCYVSVVLGSRCLADAGIELDWRTLSPLYAVAEVVLAAALVSWLHVARRWQRVLAAGLGALWVCGAVVSMGQLLWKARHAGYGFAAPAWQGSALAAWLREHSAGLTLYTNNPAALWLIAQRRSRFLPMLDEGDVSARFERAFAAKPSALVIFPHALDDTIEPEPLAARLRLGAARSFDRGRVWLSPAVSDQ